MIRKLVGTRTTSRDALYPNLGGNNYIPDPGFETSVGHWTATSSALTRDTSVFKTGVASMKVTASDTAGGATYTTDTFPSGTQLIFKSVFRGDGGSAGKFIHMKITCNGDASTQDTVPWMLSATVWKEAWCTYVLPANGTVTISIYGNDLEDGEIFYVDSTVLDTFILPVTKAVGRRMHYNDRAVFYRGVNYGNTPTEGASNTNFATEAKMLPFDMEDLADQGCNMIRIYNNSYDRNDYRRGLDVALRFGIGVILWYFIWIQSSDYREGTHAGRVNRALKVADHVLWVSRLKSHPAMIGYFFGSEGNFHVASEDTPGENNTQRDWFTLVDECAVGAKAEDPLRITGTSNGGVNFDTVKETYVPNMDVWGYTHYGGASSQVHRWSNMMGYDEDLRVATTKPAMLTEIGVGVYAATHTGKRHESGQAESDVLLLRQIEQQHEVFCGTTYFQFSDQMDDTSMYGKSDSVVGGSAVYRPKRQSFYAIKDYYTKNPPPY